MANYERGIYEPSDEVRVFDGAEDEEDVEGSRLPLLIVLALLVLAMFGGVVWLAYSQGVARGRGETPVLSAANGPEKVAPNQPGGAAVPYQNFKIYEQPAPPDDSGDAPANTAPPPAPKPAPVATAPVGARPAPQPVVAAPPPAPKPVPQAVVSAPPAAKPVPPPAAPKPAPVVAAAKPEPKPEPKLVAKSAPPPLKPTTAAQPAPQPAPKSMDALIQQAESEPAKPAAASGAPRPLVNPTPAATAKPAAGGSSVLQIGAYKSQADADAAWKAYKTRHPAVSGYSEDVAKVDLGAKGTWYRLRVAGFGTRDAATATCAKLKADGGDCMLAK